MNHLLSAIRWGTVSVLACATVSLSAATIVVDPAGLGDFREIQPALDAAVDGDLILVRPGEYVVRKPLDFNGASDPASDRAPRNFTLESEGGAAVTTIRMADPPDDPDRGSLFVFHSGEGNSSEVTGFTLAGGRGTRVTGQMHPFAGAAVLSTDGSAPSFYGCTIRGNITREGDGGTVACLGGGIRLVECKVLENGTSGLLCRDADPVDITVCEFADNAGDGANVRNTRGSIMSCRIGRNLGAGIRAERSSLLIDGGEVYENAKAGVSLEGDAGTVIQGCGIYYNAFRGIDLSESSPWILSVLVSSNSDEHGGGIHCRDGSAPAILNTEIQGNMAYDGGAVWAGASKPTLTNCLLYANAAQEGPAIKAVGGSTVRLVNCTIFRNVVRPSKGTDGAGGGGAGPGCEDSEVTLLNCIAWANDPEETCWTLQGCLVGQDPLFVDPGVFNFELTRTLDLGGDSYVIPAFVGEPPMLRPQEGSPAKDIGVLDGTVSYDFDRRHRPAGMAPDAGAYEIGSSPAVGFLRGDANSDSEVDIADPIRSLAYLFLGGAAPACLKTADADDDGAVNIGDAILLLGYLFLGGPAPAWPFGGCGLDPTADLLSCDAHAPCV